MLAQIEYKLYEEVNNIGLTEEEINLNYLSYNILERPTLSVSYILNEGY